MNTLIRSTFSEDKMYILNACSIVLCAFKFPTWIFWHVYTWLRIRFSSFETYNIVTGKNFGDTWLPSVSEYTPTKTRYFTRRPYTLGRFESPDLHTTAVQRIVFDLVALVVNYLRTRLRRNSVIYVWSVELSHQKLFDPKCIIAG